MHTAAQVVMAIKCDQRPAFIYVRTLCASTGEGFDETGSYRPIPYNLVSKSDVHVFPVHSSAHRWIPDLEDVTEWALYSVYTLCTFVFVGLAHILDFVITDLYESTVSFAMRR